MVSPRSSFVVVAFPILLASVAFLAPACGSSVAGTGGGTSTGSGGAAGCPTDPPQDGAACSGVSGECHYPVQCCGDTIATCPSGTWKVQMGGCIAEAPNPCPPTQPIAGTACTPGCLPVACTYGMCAGGNPEIFATCDGSTWQVQDNCPPDAGGGGLPAGATCGPDADGGTCAAGLACCYPCGIPGCQYQCVTACNPSDPGCSGGCMPVP
jgi:hypothetical protein